MKSTITSLVEQMLPQLSRKERLEAVAELQRIVNHERFELATETETLLVCKKCGSVHIVKRGKTAKGTQRYLCADCGNSFTLDSYNVFSASKLPSETWMKYIECFIDLLPLRECASRCGVSLKTAFFMRHRLLEAIFEYMPAFQVKEGCGATIDETFFHESFKGFYPPQKRPVCNLIYAPVELALEPTKTIFKLENRR